MSEPEEPVGVSLEIPTQEEVEQFLVEISQEYPRRARLLRAYLFATGEGEDPEARWVRLLLEMKKVAVQSQQANESLLAWLRGQAPVQREIIALLKEAEDQRERLVKAGERQAAAAADKADQKKDLARDIRAGVVELWNNKPFQFLLMGGVYFVLDKMGAVAWVLKRLTE